MLKHTYLSLLLALSCVFFTACDKDDAPPDDEQELITTVRLTLTNTANPSETATATWRDPDGDGGADPQVSALQLRPNTTYSGIVEFLDESNPADPENITEEVEEEDTDHEVYLIPSGTNLTVSNQNTDANGLILGTQATFTTAAAGTGTLRIVLKHKPGAKAANDPVTKGETDIDITPPMPYVIQ